MPNRHVFARGLRGLAAARVHAVSGQHAHLGAAVSQHRRVLRRAPRGYLCPWRARGVWGGSGLQAGHLAWQLCTFEATAGAL